MDNQHKQIKGYRDLSQAEIDLMNEIKIQAAETGMLIDKLDDLRNNQNLILATEVEVEGLTAADLANSARCYSIAKTNLQQGYMWLVRAVALPQSF